MITALATLLVSQLAGEVVVRLASLPIPGPVVDMVFLFVVMLARMPLPPALGVTADGLLRHSLLFVPAGDRYATKPDQWGRAILTQRDLRTEVEDIRKFTY